MLKANPPLGREFETARRIEKRTCGAVCLEIAGTHADIHFLLSTLYYRHSSVRFNWVGELLLVANGKVGARSTVSARRHSIATRFLTLVEILIRKVE